MTILVCQKRHHEPHFVRATRDQFGFQCTGQPAWPYTRPKPPPNALSDERWDYQLEHLTPGVYKRFNSQWIVDWFHWAGPYLEYEREGFSTHAAAINYAQKLAQERSGQRADS